MFEETNREASCGFKEKLVARVLDNLQISIRRVYFRFVDTMEVQSTSDMSEAERERLNKEFSLGIKLKEFTVYTTDKTYETRILHVNDGKYKSESDKLTFKVVRISGFSVFCNWEDVDKTANGAVDI